jgi:hypothetical protein
MQQYIPLIAMLEMTGIGAHRWRHRNVKRVKQARRFRDQLQVPSGTRTAVPNAGPNDVGDPKGRYASPP